MMNEKKHIIQKLVVDLEYNGDARGVELENMISRWCREVLLPYLESMLDKEEASDIVTRISKIELELNTDFKEEWLNTLMRKAGIALKDKLDVLQYFAGQDISVRNIEKISGFEEGSLKPVKIHNSDDFLQTLIFYLKTARLPWWWDNSLSLEKTFNDWMGSLPVDQIPNLIKELIREKEAAKRFALLCRPEIFPVTLARLHQGRQVFVKNIIPLFNKLAAYFPADKESETRIFFQATLVQSAMLTNKEFAIELSQKIHEWFEMVCEDYELRSKAAAGIKWKKEILSHVSVILDEIKTMMQSTFGFAFSESGIKISGSASKLDEITDPPDKKNGKDDKETTYSNDLAGENEKVFSANENKKETKIETEARADQSEQDPVDEPVYIINAGVILIAPLLPTLFKRLGLLSDGKIENPSLAVMLLHFITYGNEEAFEYEMPLYKILCGIPLKEAVNTRIRLEQNQKEEANEMLRSVIEFWTVLKDTSIDALRSSFLQRNGKLVMVNKEWKLMVEQKPYDMLLQQLPWSIQMIKLSWMKELVRTEWN